MTRRDTIIAELKSEMAFYHDRNRLHIRNLMFSRDGQFREEERQMAHETARRFFVAKARLNALTKKAH